MKIKAWEAALCVSLAAAILFGFSVSSEQKDLSDKLIRLHVVANSDSEDDQALKLKVRDEVLDELSSLLEDAKDKDTAERIIGGNLETLETAAKERIAAEGVDYPVAVTLAEEDFPTREYDTFSLPAGRYDSLRVTIGEGEGHNWWCVVFPPVCTAEMLTPETAAKVGLTEDEYFLITENSGGYAVKFRLMEIFAKIKEFFEQL